MTCNKIVTFCLQVFLRYNYFLSIASIIHILFSKVLVPYAKSNVHEEVDNSSFKLKKRKMSENVNDNTDISESNVFFDALHSK